MQGQLFRKKTANEDEDVHAEISRVVEKKFERRWIFCIDQYL